MPREFLNGVSTYSLLILSPSGRGVARLTSPPLGDDEIVVVIVVIVVVSADDGDNRLLEFVSTDNVSAFCARRKDDLLRKELDNGVSGMVRGATRWDVGVPGSEAVVTPPDCDGGGGGGGTDGTVAMCTTGNRGGGNGRL